MVDNREAFVERIQDHLNEYIHAADRKSSILLTAHIAFLGLFGRALVSDNSALPLDSGSLLSIAPPVLTVVSGVIAGLFAGLVVYPRTPETPSGYMLWKSIIKRSREDYREDIDSLTSDEINKEMTDENYKLAEVADKKYANLRISLIFTGLMVLFGIATFALSL